MTAKIIQFTGTTTLDLPPDVVLESAKGELEGVVIIGFRKDDEVFVVKNGEGFFTDKFHEILDDFDYERED